jgi:hypothetical protein
MLEILKYKTEITKIKESIEDIQSLLFAANERHLIKKIDDCDGVILASSLPSSNSGNNDYDNIKEKNRCVLFILEKINPGDQNETEELEHYSKMQSITKKVKDKLLERRDSEDSIFPLLAEVDESSFRTESEYQIYGGHNGYSIGFDIIDRSM